MKERIQIAKSLEFDTIGELCKVANMYQSDVKLIRGRWIIDVKSLFGLASLGIRFGSELILETQGEDEEEAFKNVKEFLTKKSAK